MKLEKPKIKRVYVTISDPDGVEKSVSFTLYDVTPKQVDELIRGAAPKGKRQAVTA